MSILFAGTPENAAVSLRELVNSGTPVTLVLTRPDAPIGRKAILTPSPVALVAQDLGIPTIKTNVVDEEVLQKIGEHGIEFALVVAFGVLLKDAAINALPKGWFNLHYSLLPELRGAAPVQWALIRGLRETGVSIFQIDKGLDTGPVVGQVRTIVEPNETAGELLSRLTQLGVSLMLQEIPRIASGLFSGSKQEEPLGELARKLSRLDGFIDFHQSSFATFNLVRGVTPEPGAWASLEGQIIKLLAVRTSPEILSPGHIVLVEKRVLVGCLDGSVELVEVQPAGKSPMKAADWLRGLKNKEVTFDARQ